MQRIRGLILPAIEFATDQSVLFSIHSWKIKFFGSGLHVRPRKTTGQCSIAREGAGWACVLSVSPKFHSLVRCTYAPGALAKNWVIETPRNRKEKSMVLLVLLFHYCIILNLENPKRQSPLRHNPHWDPLHSPGDPPEESTKWQLKPQATGLQCQNMPKNFILKKNSLVISSGCPPSITGKEKYIKEFLRVFPFSKCLLFIYKKIYSRMCQPPTTQKTCARSLYIYLKHALTFCIMLHQF